MPYYPQNPYEPIMTGMESLSGAIKDVRDRDIQRMEQKRRAEQERMNAQLQGAQVMKGLALEEAGLERGAMQDRFAAMNAYREDINRQKQLDLSKYGAETGRMTAESNIGMDTQAIAESKNRMYRTAPKLPSQIPELQQILNSDKVIDKELSFQQKGLRQRFAEMEAAGIPISPDDATAIIMEAYSLSPAGTIANFMKEMEPYYANYRNIPDVITYTSIKNLTEKVSFGEATVKAVEVPYTVSTIDENGQIVQLKQNDWRRGTGRVLTDEELIVREKQHGMAPIKLKTEEKEGEQYSIIEYVPYWGDTALPTIGAGGSSGAGVGVGGVSQIPPAELRTVQQIREDYARLHPQTIAGVGGMSVVPMVTSGQQYGTAKTLGEMEREVRAYKETKANKMVSDAITRLENSVKDAQGIPNFVLEVNAFDFSNSETRDWFRTAIKSGKIPSNWYIKTPDGIVPVSSFPGLNE